MIVILERHSSRVGVQVDRRSIRPIIVFNYYMFPVALLSIVKRQGIYKVIER